MKMYSYLSYIPPNYRQSFAMFNSYSYYCKLLFKIRNNFATHVLCSKLCSQEMVTANTLSNFPISSYWEETSIYVHWPYCKQLCSYCNFVKFVPKKGASWTLDNQTLENAMLRELEEKLSATHVKKVTSVFFGGGTPSLARPELIHKVLTAARAKCDVSHDIEVALEGSPSSLSYNALKAFKEAGVNRVSIGIQSLRDEELQFLRRDHTREEALDCLRTAKELLPGRVSIDLLFGRPSQTVDMWREELNEMVGYCDDHIALYQLTLERGTPLYEMVKEGIAAMPGDDAVADMYELAVARLKRAGFHRYEVANFSRNPVSESTHNKNYWQAGQYIGIGPGAHSRIVPKTLDLVYWQDCMEAIRQNNNYDWKKPTIREATINALDPRRWLSEVNSKGTGAVKCEKQSRLDVLSEYLATGLRTTEGVRDCRWRTLAAGVAIVNIFSHESLINFVDSGYISWSPTKLSATEKGINVLDSLLPDIILILNKYS